MAKFCEEYGYSPFYILLGTGRKKERRGKVFRVDKRNKNEIMMMMFNKISKQLRELDDKGLDIIKDLLSGMLELKASWSDTHKQLVEKGKKHIKN